MTQNLIDLMNQHLGVHQNDKPEETIDYEFWLDDKNKNKLKTPEQS